MSEPHPALSASPAYMLTTCWSVVLEAGRQGPEGGAALDQLCRRYWPAVFGFFVRSGFDRADAEDETQEFFATLLRREGLAGVAPEKGRFRSFLLTCLKNHMATALRRGTRQKRGGGSPVVTLDTGLADRIASGAEASEAPEAAYDRHWAESVIQHTSLRLEAEYKAAGRGARFAALREFLMWDGGELSGRELAERLGESETAVRSAIFRLRRRFGLLLREEVAGTLGPGEDVDEEVRYMARILSE